MKVRTRLVVGFAVVAVLIITTGVLSLHTYLQIHEEVEKLNDDIVPDALATAKMEQLATETHFHLMEYMIYGEEKDRGLVQSGLEDLKKAGLEHLKHETHIGLEERKKAKELMAKTRSFASAVAGIIDLKRRGVVTADELFRKKYETVHPAFSTLTKQLKGHMETHREKLAEAKRDVHKAYTRGLAVLVLATTGALLAGFATAFITSRSITRPVQTLQEGAANIAKGNLDFRINMKQKDEIGQLGRAFDRMSEDLSDTLVSKEALENANRQLKSEIIERKKAEEAIHASEENLRITLGSIGDGVIAVDTQRRVTRLNHAAEQLTGWALEEALGKPMDEVFRIINEETGVPAKDPVAEVLATGKTADLANHTVLIARDGTELPISDSASPIRDASGEIVGVVLVFSDVSEKRQREKEKDQLLHDLGERVKEISCLYSLSQIAADPSITLDDILRKTAKILPPSWQYPEITRARIRFEEQIFESEDWSEGPWHQSADILVHGQKRGSVEVCYCQERPERGEGPFLEEERALIDTVAERLGEIAERLQAQEELARKDRELERTNAELTARNAELDEFTYVASHDLQEPLRKLTSFSDLLRMDVGKNLPPDATKDLDFITDAACRMQRLIHDLLALSRTGRSAMEAKEISLSRCAAGVLESLSMAIEESDAVITQDELPDVYADTTLMIQLYQNLIGNALKFTADRRPEIHLTFEESDGVRIFGVSDNGIGIDPKYAEHIFRPFKRLHGRAEYQGSGIGLAICRKIVERHGGEMWVESQLGEGTHFKFTLHQPRKGDSDDNRNVCTAGSHSAG